jgi:cell division protein FtsL
MAAVAIYGFIGVLLGSATTAVLTVYRERLISTREREARQHQREQDRTDQRNVFQRQSLLGLQDAVSELINAVYSEQDRMLAEKRRTGRWPARQWETPTTTVWEDANLQLQVSRARIFDEAIRDIARDIRNVSRDCIYATSLHEAEQFNERLRKLYENFNDLVADALPRLY